MQRIKLVVATYLILFSLIGLMGCKKNFNNVEEFEKYARGDDSPYKTVVEKNGVKFTLLYLPTQSVMIPHYRKFLEDKKNILSSQLNEALKTDSIKSLKSLLKKNYSSYEKSIYFILKIGYADSTRDIVYSSMDKGFDNYSIWLQKLMFSLRENISLLAEGEEIPLSFYNMENSYGMTKDRTFLLVFPRQDQNKKIDVSEKIKIRLKEFGLATGNIIIDCGFIKEDKIKLSFL